MEKVMIDTTEYQQRVLECIGSEKVDKLFGSTIWTLEFIRWMFKRRCVLLCMQ